MPERKLDIFEQLKQADLKNVNYYKNLTDDERKGFYPFLLARWLSGTKDRGQIIVLNEFANTAMFSLHAHKELLWKLMLTATSGKPKRYTWNKVASSGTRSKPLSTEIVAKHFNYSLRDAEEILPLLKIQGVLDIAEGAGLQPDEIKKIQLEFKDKTTVASKRKKADDVSIVEF